MLQFLVLLLAAAPVLLVSLDGFRHDYIERDKPPELSALADGGARVMRMSPSFSSTTFPNHHSMATGLEPARHGVVAMEFYDPQLGRSFSYRKTASEAVWYGGTSIWAWGKQHGKRVFTYFWPGTDAGAGGGFPDEFRKYDYRVTHEQKVSQVIEWLSLPEGKRPDLVIAYFSDADSAGHQKGPDAPETRAAIARVDGTVGKLVREAKRLVPGLNVVIVSDHGMAAVDRVIDMTSWADYTGCVAANELPMTMLYCKDPGPVEAALRKHSDEVDVYRRNTTPASWRFRGNPRIGDLVVVPKRTSIVYVGLGGEKAPDLKGMHGYAADRVPEVGAILIGSGPAFKAGARLAETRSVDVMPLLCELMGIPAPKGIDGRLNEIKKLLKQ
jgi:alkaline phosphatase D